MIITSLLDTDLYKFSMMQVVLHHFPAAQVEYRYKCRTRGVDLHPYLDEIREEVHQLCQLRFTEDELNYLRGLRFIKSDFVDFLGLFHMPERCIHIAEGDAPGEISIEVRARGCTPSSSRSRCWPSSTGLFPQHAQASRLGRRPQAAAVQDAPGAGRSGAG